MAKNDGSASHSLCNELTQHFPDFIRFGLKFDFHLTLLFFQNNPSFPSKVRVSIFYYVWQMNGYWPQLHGTLTPAHACGCAAQCFESVQRGSIIIKPKVFAHAVPLAFPGSNPSPLPFSEESWLSPVRQLTLAFRIHLPYIIFKVPKRLYIRQKRLALSTGLFSQRSKILPKGVERG